MLAHSRKKAGSIVFDCFNWAAMLLIIIVCLYPIYRLLIISLNDAADASRGGIYFYPRVPSLASYGAVFSEKTIYLAFVVSVARTVAGTAAGLLVTGLLAYGLSKKILKFRKFYTVFCLITMFFSGGLISYYILILTLHLDNPAVYILPNIVNVWNMIILRTFFENIPESLEESARIDGGGHYRIFFSVVVPLSVPSLMTVGLFVAVFQWNSWFDAVLFVNTKFYPMQTVLQTIMNQVNGGGQSPFMPPSGSIKLTPKSIEYAAIIITMLPIVIVYPFIQKYFIKGIMLGSVKE